jgi:4-hydroxy-2-oxoglutarate aldolase
MLTLQGIIPPIPTPFKENGDLDLTALKTMIGALEPDVDGFLVLGSNGEAPYLSDHERRQVFEAAREAIPATKPMLVGTGAEATRHAAERNREAHDLGADGVLVLPPHYFVAAMTDGVLEKHYSSLADASPLPLMLYNLPAATTLSLSPTLIGKLAAHENIVGLKDSSGNIPALTEIMRLTPPDFQVMTGNAPTFLAALALGARGGILAVANVAARHYRKLLDAFKAGDLDTARVLQTRLNPLALAVTARFGVPGLKAAMQLQGIGAGYPRAPLQTLTDTTALEALLTEVTPQPA